MTRLIIQWFLLSLTGAFAWGFMIYVIFVLASSIIEAASVIFSH